MNNFGVIEVASTKTTHAPGWAYVPDTGINPAVAALQPASRKRAGRGGPNPSLSDVSARQETKVRKELEALDRDGYKDAQIPIPPKAGGGGRAQNKHTPNVRKILQSQKTFANHLDDYLALVAQAETNPAAAALVNPALAVAAAPPSKANSPAPALGGGSKRAGGGGHKKKGGGGGGNSSRRASAAVKAEEQQKQQQQQQQQQPPPVVGDADVEMADAAASPLPSPQSQLRSKQQSQSISLSSAPAEVGPRKDGQSGQDGEAAPAPESEPFSAAAPPPPLPSAYPPDGTILPAYQRPPPTPHPGDTDPLLMSAVPPFPTDAELRALLMAPPLGYLEARATWGPAPGVEDGAAAAGLQRYPPRQFCVVCGYWGRVRCLKCGGRVCALDCLDVHREECLTRYGL